MAAITSLLSASVEAQPSGAADLGVLVLDLDPSSEGAWLEASHRTAAELRQVGHRVTSARSEGTDPTQELIARLGESDAVAAVLVHLDAGRAHCCLALQDVVVCRYLETSDDADAALLVVEWLHENLLARGLWRPARDPDPVVPVAPIVPIAPPIVTARHEWRLEVLGGVYVAFDRAGLWGIATVRASFIPIDEIAIGLELRGSIVPLSIADARASATIGFGAARARVLADVLADRDVELGPMLALGALLVAGTANAVEPFVGQSGAIVAFHGDVGAHFGIAFAPGWLVIAEAAVTLTAPSIDIRFVSDSVVAVGGAGFDAQLGIGALL